MDASALKVAPTTTVHVKSPSGEPLYDAGNPCRIHLHGRGSRAYSIVETRVTQRSMRRMNDNDMKLTAPTAEERRDETAEDLAELTISFENLAYGDKTGADLFKAYYSDPELGYITAQVNKHLADWGNAKLASALS